MSEMHLLPIPVPDGSSLFASVMSDINAPPVVKISAPDEIDDPNPTDEGKEIHGLQCCYKIENGKYVPKLFCNHDHRRLSNGHIDEIAVGASDIGLKNSVRRRSITNLEEFSSHSGSNSSQRRRASLQPASLRQGSSSPSLRRRSSIDVPMSLSVSSSGLPSTSSHGRRASLQPALLRPGSSSPSLRRRASIDVPKSPSGSPSGSPQTKSPQRSPNGSRRGSNASINSEDLHYVYEQMNLKERKK